MTKDAPSRRNLLILNNKYQKSRQVRKALRGGGDNRRKVHKQAWEKWKANEIFWADTEKKEKRRRVKNRNNHTVARQGVGHCVHRANRLLSWKAIHWEKRGTIRGQKEKKMLGTRPSVHERFFSKTGENLGGHGEASKTNTQEARSRERV